MLPSVFPLEYTQINSFFFLSIHDIACLLQMEKEIKELKSQRDLAQSRLQDLLQVVGDRDPKHQVFLLV